MPIELDDVCFNKAAIIERALRRTAEEFRADPQLKNWTNIDAMTLNVQRACQAAIDLGMHVVSKYRLGMPQSSADAFTLLARGKLISEKTSQSLTRMTAFRNVAVHEYQVLDLKVLETIARDGGKDLVAFASELGLRIQV